MSEKTNGGGAQFRAGMPESFVQQSARTTIVGGRPHGRRQPTGKIPRNIEVLLKKAAIDREFREILFEDPNQAAASIELELEPIELAMLQTFPKDQLAAIINQTKVPESHRLTFLGKSAIAMLILLTGGIAGIACRNTVNETHLDELSPQTASHPGLKEGIEEQPDFTKMTDTEKRIWNERNYVPPTIISITGALADLPGTPPPLSPDELSAKLIHYVPPVYPEMAKFTNLEGYVSLEVTVNEEGAVVNVQDSNGPFLLRQAAIDAVKQWRYSPTTRDNEPIQVKGSVIVYFKLDDNYMPIRIDGEELSARLIHYVPPVYPKMAKTARVQGDVVLDVFVNEEGVVAGAGNIYSGPPLIRQSAVDTVKQWRYSPTMLNGKPIPVVARVTVKFTLN